MSVCDRIRIKLAQKLLGKRYIILTVEEYEVLQQIKQEYKQKREELERRLKELEVDSSEYIYLKKFVTTLVELERELHSIDNADMIIMHTMRRACEFYGADWSGFLDVDTVMGVWSPYRWYNPASRDRTKELMAEFESIDYMKRWMEAMETNQPIFIPDVEVFKETDPEEYEMYHKLQAKSILAVPVFPRPIGFLVVRNPTEHMSPEQSAMLQMFAYVMLTNINDKKSTEMLTMTYTSEDIKNPNEIMVKMFGELKIITSSVEVDETAFASPSVVRLIVYLLLHNKRSYTSREIADVFWRDDIEIDPAKAAGNLRTQVSRTRKEMKNYGIEDFLLASSSGYYLNPKYTIKTDVQMFRECIISAGSTNSTLDKVDLMKKAVDMYHGDILSSAAGEHWLMQDSSRCHLDYIGVLNELLQMFAKLEEFSSIQKYAEKSLAVAPGNMRAYYWLVIAYNHLNTSEYSRIVLKRASDALTDCDYADLLDELQKNSEITS